MVLVASGGEAVEVTCELDRFTPLLVAGGVGPAVPAGAASLVVDVQRSREPFSRNGMHVVTRGAWSDGSAVLVQDACSSGFDLLVTPPAGPTDAARVTARYRPSRRTAAANAALRGRFRLLAQQTLLLYPLLWRAGLRGRVPLHVSAFVPGNGVQDRVGTQPRSVLLAGPGGVGKSTLLLAEVREGAQVTSDNLCVWGDGVAHGVVEPLRVEGGSGRRTSHGRREQELPARVDRVRPEVVAVLRRGPEPFVRRACEQVAADALVAGTYSAGELRRYWGLAAVLALGTGLRPAHPPVAEVAQSIAADLPCLEVCLGEVAPGEPTPTVSSVLTCLEEVP